MNRDPYFSRNEVSNSDLTALRDILHPRPATGDRDAAFRFGTLVDALVTEPSRVDWYSMTVDGIPYTQDEFRHGQEMLRSLRMAARKDAMLAKVLAASDCQKVMVNRGQTFSYCGFGFELDTRCKWDWWLGPFGGDLKTTSAATQAQFEEAIDRFDWDRSRAWYMDIAGSGRDFIYAVSKANGNVFRKFITRGDALYERGREKYEELAFQWWCLSPRGGSGDEA